MEPEALPLATVSPLTFIVALAWLKVGVTVIEDKLFETLSVYEAIPLENAGLNVPLLIVILLKVESS